MGHKSAARLITGMVIACTLSGVLVSHAAHAQEAPAPEALPSDPVFSYLSCTVTGGELVCNIEVPVVVPEIPSCTLTASSQSVIAGSGVALTLQTQKAVSATISKVGTVPVSGSVNVTVTEATTYTATVRSATDHTATCSTAVAVEVETETETEVVPEAPVTETVSPPQKSGGGGGGGGSKKSSKSKKTISKASTSKPEVAGITTITPTVGIGTKVLVKNSTGNFKTPATIAAGPKTILGAKWWMVRYSNKTTAWKKESMFKVTSAAKTSAPASTGTVPQNVKPTSVTPTYSTLTTGNSKRVLTLGSAGEDVRTLQKLLNRDSTTRVASSGAGSPGYESTVFGNLTREAVKRFQLKHSIIPVNGEYGTVESATRARLLALYGVSF